MHNHPSGDPTPSQAPCTKTETMTFNYFCFAD
ncbi:MULTISPECIES: JAB domain-containing protein [unclassified Bradyrhizobium]